MSGFIDGQPRPRLRVAELSGEWIFGVRNSAERPEEPVSDVASLTPNAVQRKWKTPAKFEQCPEACSSDALTEYAVRLREGAVFAHDAYGQSVIVTAQQGEGFLSVVCHLPNNPMGRRSTTSPE